ncbi:Asp-tRNA(Asn)/Glu-tRNA(Gln) amidotransferase subunit GatA [Gulosibacter bifidus]|uniref:Glutamyl-tRNA(Gln) amidotransferase subunit A n=1 Tax=Gulosibacter bifidus TaxID=272239 RepID=A0ABW5RI56_9MICO|nr:Asp-tRNA(Asn)/Glu-tRNA(Gln) amidotransferase subunit GatA [Gulosibacter bifidus]
MNDMITRSASELAAALAAGETTSVELTQAHLDRIESVDGALHAFLKVDGEGALEQAAAADAARNAGEATSPLAGVPVAVKDNIATLGLETTAASRILEGWKPPYDAHVVERLKAAGMPILGKTNLDEFAMGSSSEHSAYGTTYNPWDLERVPGGSGGGSAAAVAAFEAPLALGTDTGGSIRQPAAFTGTVGMKPTYGAVSRYGALAMGSSLDQIGPAARTVLDAAMLQDVIGGHDERDQTSINRDWPSFADAARAGAEAGSMQGLRIGVAKQYLDGEGIDPEVLANFTASLERCRELGAEIVNLDLKTTEYAVAAYYLLMPAEVSSNLARYDSVRFGLRVVPEGKATTERVMSATRAAGFGDEVKRRILLGTYALSSGYYDAYYGSAQKVRTLLQREFDDAFTKVDVLAAPTTTEPAFKVGENINDPMAMYLADLTTIPANLAGLPAISLPSGLVKGLPVGVQFMGPSGEDARLYKAAAALEHDLVTEWGGTLLAQAPEIKEAQR